MQKGQHLPFIPLPTDAALWRLAGERVVSYRRAHSEKKHGRRQPLSQQALAKRAGVSPGCLQAFENNTRATQRESVQRIAAAVGLSLGELFAPDHAGDVARVQRRFAVAMFDESSDPDRDNIEGNAMKRMFLAALTPMRMSLWTQAVDHFKGRKDRAAASVIEDLQISGLEPLTNGPPSSTSSDPAASSLHVFPPLGKDSPSAAPPVAHTRRKTGGR
jgi:transcriptional regulator with XRE-family HTH domain